MNEVITIKDMMSKIIGDYQQTTGAGVTIDFRGGDGVTSISNYASIQTGIGSLDVVWVASAILLIVGFICIMGLIKSVLTAVIR